MRNFDLNTYLKELEHLVSIDSGSRVPGGTSRVADYLEEKYRALGLDVKRTITNDFGAPMLEIRNRPETARLDVTFMGHMDTVFPEGEPTRRPYTTDGEYAYGPGVADMKCGLLVTYYIVKALCEDQVDLSSCVLLNADEEISSVHSQKRIGEVAALSDYCFVMEPGRGNGDYVSERKGLARFKIVVEGVAAHAGVAPQDGANAINEAAYMTLEMEKLNHYEIGTSVNVGTIKGGTSANVVCDHVECLVDTRFDDIEELRKIEAVFDGFMNHPRNPRTTVSIVREGYRPPMVKTEKTEALMALMTKLGAELGMRVNWVKTGGGSDGNFAAFAGSTVVDGVGPIGDKVHGPKELLRIDSIEPRMDVLYKTLLALAAQKNG